MNPPSNTLLATASEIAALSAHLAQQDTICFDTEFIRETTFYPELALLQLATDRDAWLVDVLAFRGEKTRELQPLLDVFTDPRVLKVVHASQGDQECLYTRFGIVAKHTLDTALAGSLCGFGDGAGLATLLKSVLNINIKKGHARTDWTLRPLPAQLQEYALADVEHLVALARALMDRLAPLGRVEWAKELSSKFEDPSLYETDPEAIARRLFKSGKVDRKMFPVLLELVRWREKRVRELNVPRKWVADDQLLVDLARVRPRDMNHLGTFRGLNKGEARKSGQAILDAIAAGLNAKDVSWPERSSFDPASDEEERAIDLLKCYVGLLGDRHQIATKHLISGQDFLRLLRSKELGIEQWVTNGILSHGAARLIGEDVLAALNGRKALSLESSREKGTKIRVVDVNE